MRHSTRISAPLMTWPRSSVVRLSLACAWRVHGTLGTGHHHERRGDFDPVRAAAFFSRKMAEPHCHFAARAGAGSVSTSALDSRAGVAQLFDPRFSSAAPDDAHAAAV